MALSSCYSEDNTVRECYQFFKGNPLLQSFQVVETTINDDTGSVCLTEKVSLLVNLVGQIFTSNLLKIKNDQILVVFNYFHEHILKLILHGDWGKSLAIKQHLSTTLKRLAVALEKRFPIFVKNVQYLITLLSDPWGSPTMKKIFNEEGPTDGEELDLIKSEIGQVLAVRLKILIEAKCEDQALRLIEVCLKCVRDLKNETQFQSSSNEITHIQDMYLILLVKTKKVTKTIDEAKRMEISECLKMIQRCTTENIPLNLRKSHIKMVSFVTTTVLTTAMMNPISEEPLLVDIIQAFFNINSNIQQLAQPLRKFLTIASSSQHMYLLGQVFTKHFGVAGQALCAEIYVRALAVNLNELEKHKNNLEYEAQDLSEFRLHNGFLLLADCFHKDVFLNRECVLSAFSVKPSETCLAKLQEIAIETNNNEINPEFHGTDWNMNSFVNRILASPIYIPPADDLGITQTLCDDLAIVIGSARFKELNWNLGWEELVKRCDTYMKEDWTNFRNSKKELMFLTIDYDQFRNVIKSEKAE